MSKESLSEYLNHNRIVKVGDETGDIIVSDWKAFLRFLYSNGYYVEYILWWEHLLISDRGLGKKTLGGGGPIDTINNGYYYGETMIDKEFSDNDTITDVEKYLNSTISAYKPHILIPSFTVRHNTMNTEDGSKQLKKQDKNT